MKKKQRSNKPQDKYKKRYCFFCKNKIQEIDYKDTNLLKRSVSDKGKIKARRTTGACVQHQHQLARAIKRARQMALISYGGSGKSSERTAVGRR